MSARRSSTGSSSREAVASAAATAVLARCGMTELTTKDWTFAQDVSAYARHGFGAIGICLQKLEDPPFASGYLPIEPLDFAVIDAAATQVRDAGLRVSHLVVSGVWTEEGRRAARIEHTLFAMEAAERLDAGCLIVVPGPSFGRSFGTNLDIAVDALSTIFERATVRARLAIEPLRSGQVDFLNTLGEAMQVVERVGHPDLGVWFDTWHLWRTPSLYEDIAHAGKRIFGVHLSDSIDDDSGEAPRLVPGDGLIPFGQILEALDATGYDGWYEIEMEVHEQGPGDYEALLRRIGGRLSILLSNYVRTPARVGVASGGEM